LEFKKLKIEKPKGQCEQTGAGTTHKRGGTHATFTGPAKPKSRDSQERLKKKGSGKDGSGVCETKAGQSRTEGRDKKSQSGKKKDH